ncbi:TDP-N-acetylfucosamine:lipid II N-acetylfucosaminyltransferase [Pseudoalteromonas sp. KAN5]|uniref:TDP-N-acetylfucosamine:lipid II N-acetylfucosaminyltransferase n=1 Tax=Pseudoalteromonas sp. KAN5 TaxID=2916633 RepID=UPI001FCC8911|nr:TDP-N-acetylfucosamine:lipid II N-acetylfucosaminyltransferase [Pseudoalteromonas sp. KAN5]BDF95573.1 hypothetical protein KAN5_24110 [Pseudoalteromonas sp. KAN5]
MKDKKILHVAECDKFIPPFVDFVNDNFNPEEHDFLLKSGMADSKLKKNDNVRLSGGSIFSKLKHHYELIIKMHGADKVILHSLIDFNIVKVLFFTPWLHKKCYWMIWGADLYAYKSAPKTLKGKVNEFLRRRVISNLGHLVTYLDGDIALARKWYGAKGTYHECLMYTSNLYKEYELPESTKSTVNIQLGNSADPSNNHIEALEKLLPFKNENICIFAPLSYGQQEYAQQVIAQGEKWFGDKFKPFTEFMSFEDYLLFLGSIDIALFNHKRQQAMGNIITLLGLDKTVYIRSDTTQWQFFEKKDVKVGDIGTLNSLDYQKGTGNVEIIKAYFSLENYKKQLTQLFDY